MGKQTPVIALRAPMGVLAVSISVGLILERLEFISREDRTMKTNYGAIVVSAVAYWMLGALWYGVLFGQRWMALEGITMEQAKRLNPVLPYVIALVLNLLMAFVLAQLCCGEMRIPRHAARRSWWAVPTRH